MEIILNIVGIDDASDCIHQLGKLHKMFCYFKTVIFFISQSVIDLNYMNRHFNEVLFFFVINPNMIQSWA